MPVRSLALVPMLVAASRQKGCESDPVGHALPACSVGTKRKPYSFAELQQHAANQSQRVAAGIYPDAWRLATRSTQNPGLV